MQLRNDFRSVRRLTGQQCRLLIEAGGLLVVARLGVWLVPFRRLAAHLGDEKAESPSTDIDQHRATAAQIGWAVRTLGRRLPWMSQCLVQAVAATWMLRRRRIASTLYLGVAKNADGQVNAHAWVRSGAQVLTGIEGHQEFKVVTTYALPRENSSPDWAPSKGTGI